MKPLSPPSRVLMGPGPSDVDPAVLRAMSAPTVGHLDPWFLQIMDETASMLRELFGTDNAVTMPLSGTGSAGMEALFANLIEPGDRVMIGVNGVFGGRMCEVARRCGADVVRVDRPWGETFTPDDFRAAGQGQRCALIATVHAETSTGALQDLEGLREVADEVGALLALDCVTSLGGLPIELDEHGVDAVYSGTQKCLSAPPGLSPVSFSERALDAIARRSKPPQSWYLDLGLLGAYWKDGAAKRAYHHTAPINTIYALHEACRLALEEGLTQRAARHQLHGAALREGLRGLGLELPVPVENQMPQLTVVRIPDGVDDAAVRSRLLTEYGLEIGGGLGAFAGKVWRIGLMGSACTARNVTLCLGALRNVLQAPRRS